MKNRINIAEFLKNCPNVTVECINRMESGIGRMMGLLIGCQFPNYQKNRR